MKFISLFIIFISFVTSSFGFVRTESPDIQTIDQETLNLFPDNLDNWDLRNQYTYQNDSFLLQFTPKDAGSNLNEMICIQLLDNPSTFTAIAFFQNMISSMSRIHRNFDSEILEELNENDIIFTWNSAVPHLADTPPNTYEIARLTKKDNGSFLRISFVKRLENLTVEEKDACVQALSNISVPTN